MVNEIDRRTFDSDVQGKCMVDFYTSGCPICEKLSPVFESVSLQHPGIRFFKVNLEDDITLAERFAIDHVPTTILFRDGAPVSTFVGFMEEDKLIEMVLSEELLV